MERGRGRVPTEEELKDYISRKCIEAGVFAFVNPDVSFIGYNLREDMIDYNPSSILALFTVYVDLNPELDWKKCIDSYISHELVHRDLFIELPEELRIIKIFIPTSKYEEIAEELFVLKKEKAYKKDKEVSRIVFLRGIRKIEKKIRFLLGVLEDPVKVVTLVSLLSDEEIKEYFFMIAEEVIALKKISNEMNVKEDIKRFTPEIRMIIDRLCTKIRRYLTRFALNQHQ